MHACGQSNRHDRVKTTDPEGKNVRLEFKSCETYKRRLRRYSWLEQTHEPDYLPSPRDTGKYDGLSAALRKAASTTDNKTKRTWSSNKRQRTLELKKPCRNSRAQPQAKPRQWTETKDAKTLRHHELHRLPATSTTIRYLELRKGFSLSTHTCQRTQLEKRTHRHVRQSRLTR